MRAPRSATSRRRWTGTCSRRRSSWAPTTTTSADRAARAPSPGGIIGPTTAWDAREEIAAAIRRAPPALFLDYDGTLSPIVPRPEMAVLAPAMRSVLERLSAKCLVAIVSGRDLRDVQERVTMPHLVFAGSHGFDIEGPDGLHEQHAAGAAALPSLDSAEAELLRRAGEIPGVQVERKRFAIAVHFRNADEHREPDVARMVDDVLAMHPGLRKGFGKKVLELRPDVSWDKGRAVLWLLDALKLDAGRATAIYIGDDVTDEDAFQALAEGGRGIGIVVGPEGETAARYQLADVDDVERFLAWIDGELGAGGPALTTSSPSPRPAPAGSRRGG